MATCSRRHKAKTLGLAKQMEPWFVVDVVGAKPELLGPCLAGTHDARRRGEGSAAADWAGRL